MTWQKECGNCGWKNDGRETRCHICGAKLGDGHEKTDKRRMPRVLAYIDGKLAGAEVILKIMEE